MAGAVAFPVVAGVSSLGISKNGNEDVAASSWRMKRQGNSVVKGTGLSMKTKWQKDFREASLANPVGQTVRAILLEPGQVRDDDSRYRRRFGPQSSDLGFSWPTPKGDIESDLAFRRQARGGEAVAVEIARRSLSGAVGSSSYENGGGARELVAPASDPPEAELETDGLWLEIRSEARDMSEAEPALASYLYSSILSHRSLEKALAFHLANKLGSSTLLSTQLFSLIADTFMDDQLVREAFRADMRAVRERDAACDSYTHCMLNFKGYLAIQTHRVAHRLWSQGRRALALALQSRVSEVFHVDIHPAAKFGKGVMFDHATGVVIGETAEIGNDVSMLHHVTLGGTGAVVGDRHPKVRDGVLIGAGATILGNIVIGEGAKIGAGSMVLSDVPPHTTAVGNPARLVGGKDRPAKLKEIPSETMDHTSFALDYVI